MSKRISRGEAAYYLYKISNQVPATSISVTISSYTNTANNLPEAENFPAFLDVWSSLKNEYLYKDELDDEELIYSAIKGMLENVSDKYTVFEEPIDAQDLLDSLSGDYEGIGIIIEIIDKNITIVTPFNDSPAEKAGLKANDIIIEVDGENVIGYTLTEVANKIKGPSETNVDIKVLRKNNELTFTVTRNFILLSTINGEMISSGNKNIGYIELLNFGEDTYEEFLKTSNDLLENNPDGLIIDLRNNPGGFLDIAVNILGLFSQEVLTAVKLEYADGLVEEYKTNGVGLLQDYEIVVLINEGSASASEILAGALQDHGIAKIIGAQSFGKGSVQNLNQYDDNSFFKYTISRWLTPNGKNISGTGITPDKIVNNSKNKDEQLDAALEEF